MAFPPLDSLTGLLGGASFESRVQELLDSADRSPAALLVADLDRLHNINDLLGYQGGDDALRCASGRLAGPLPDGAISARLGGDKFAIFTRPCAFSEALNLASAALERLRQPLMLQGREIHLSASVGLALSPVHGASAQSLLRAATDAMRRAKQRGGNAMEVASGPSPDGEARYRMETNLRHAIERGEFTLRYQPQVDRSGELRGLEALLGWDHPTQGRIPPEQFIPIAEEIGVISDIGARVLFVACRQVAEWRARGLNPPRVAVNVSPHQFASRDFVCFVEHVLASCGLPGSALELEITEGAVLRDVEESASRMAKLRTLGVRIVIDDFGVGHSTLSYLHRLPLDALKVDRSFMEGITRAGGTLPVVHTISVLAHQRGLQVVGEGIETPAELEMACAARCDLLQGFLFGEALTAPQVAELLADRRPLSRHFKGRAATHY